MKTPETIKNLKNAKILWFVLISELTIIMSAVYFFLDDKDEMQIDDKNFIFLYISYFVVIVFIPLSFWFHKKLGIKSKKELNIQTRSEIFLKSVIYRLALLEIGGLTTVAAFYFSGISEPIYMFGIVFIATLMSMPSEKQFDEEYNPDDDLSDDNNNENIIIEDIKN
jgi:hypothetical protein